jgi:CheY-like chemotaxis protein
MIVGSAEEALPYLNMGERFDLILCDIQLTGMSGLEFTRTVRAMNTDFSQTVPILALTGNVEATDVKACLDAGMNGHLAKPIDPDLFEQTLDDMAAQPAGAGPRHSGPSGGIGGGAGRPTIAPALGVETELELLSTLRESLGDAQLNELLRGLYAKTEEIIAALAGQSPIDLEFTRARAHEMKGMCGNFGLSKLAEHSKKIEKQAKDGRTAGLADLIDQLAPLYDRGRDEITAWMQGA